MTSRQRLRSGLLMAALTIALAAPVSAGPAVISTERFVDLQTVPLWPGRAPGAKGDSPADVPSLTVFRPFFGRANGTAIIVAPGGGYVNLAASLEGRQVADWFSARGVTAFVLNYRLGARYPFPVPLTDAQRALRFVRANANRWGLSPDKIGMIGFSAGGHLTAMAATGFTKADGSAADPVDRVSDRPDFIVLGYPVIGWMDLRPDGGSRYCEAIKLQDCHPESYAGFAPDRLVRADSPPAFLYHTGEDELGLEDSIRFYRALRAQGVSAEMHIFAKGPHGTGLGDGDPQLDTWPVLLEGWLRQRDLLTRPAAKVVEHVPDGGPLSLDSSVGRLMADQRAKALLEKYLGRDDLAETATWLGEGSVARDLFAFTLTITDEQLRTLDHDLRKLPVKSIH